MKTHPFLYSLVEKLRFWRPVPASKNRGQEKWVFGRIYPTYFCAHFSNDPGTNEYLLRPPKTYSGLIDLHGPWHGDRQNCAQTCSNGNIVYTHLGIAACECALRFAHVVCESWGPMCISYIPHVVHWSMHPACTGRLHLVRVGLNNIENGRKWPKMHRFMVGANGAHVRLGQGCALELVSSPMCPTYLLGVAQTPLDLGMAASPNEPMILD